MIWRCRESAHPSLLLGAAPEQVLDLLDQDRGVEELPGRAQLVQGLLVVLGLDPQLASPVAQAGVGLGVADQPSRCSPSYRKPPRC